MATEVVDALPYIDHGYDEPGVREAALALVEEETRRYRPTKNYLDHLPPLNVTAFETSLMRAEFERVAARRPLEMLSMKRYELPTPPAGKMTDVGAWCECVDNSLAQLQHQATRIENLQLMMEHGGGAWRTHNELVSGMVASVQRELQAVKKNIQEVNWSRKQAQLGAGEELQELETTWVGLVAKNYEIEQACVNLERQLCSLKEEISDMQTG